MVNMSYTGITLLNGILNIPIRILDPENIVPVWDTIFLSQVN